jgi:tetratricopeptide (TPR) repeat protein
VLKFQARREWLTPSLADIVLEAWRKAIKHCGLPVRRRIADELSVEGLYVRARACTHAGDFERSARLLAEVTAMAPTFAAAFEALGEVFDRMGKSDLSRHNYDVARKLRGHARPRNADRGFILRNQPSALHDIVAYTAVLRSGASKRGALIYAARGNAYLAHGRAKLALLDYGQALKLAPSPEVGALRAEALAMLGRYTEAERAFDAAIAAGLLNAESHGGRAIVRLALGKLEDADSDWRQQLEMLAATCSAARACVLLRLADWEGALPELQAAINEDPTELHWRVYRVAASRRLGRPVEAGDLDGASGNCWPAPLLALYANQLSPDDVLQRADDAARRAEAMFHIGVAACDPAEAHRWWTRVVETTAPSVIEHASARHELARMKCAP